MCVLHGMASRIGPPVFARAPHTAAGTPDWVHIKEARRSNDVANRHELALLPQLRWAPNMDGLPLAALAVRDNALDVLSELLGAAAPHSHSIALLTPNPGDKRACG